MPSNLWNPTYKLKPDQKNYYTRRAFKYYSFKYGLLVFLAGGYYFTDGSHMRDDFMSRPDINASRKMTGDIPIRERKVFEIMEGNYFGKSFENAPQSWVKRFKKFIYPSIHYEPDYEPFYDYKNRPYHPEDLSTYYSN